MSKSFHALTELCRQVAAGDADAREEFDRNVAPLIGVITRHAMARGATRSAPRRKLPSASERLMSEPARHGESPSGLVDRICRALIEKVRIQSRQPGAETLVRRMPQQTQLSPVQA